jgi:tetratricopeptide (TPR) repeat protein
VCTLDISAINANEAIETTTLKEADLTDWDARLEYARLLSNLHRYDESLVQYQKLLDEKPNFTTVLVEKAQVLYYQGNLKDSLTILEKIPPSEIDQKTELIMAEIYQGSKQYATAESIYRKLLKQSPDDNQIKLKLAQLLSWNKQYEESIALYREILNDLPNDNQVRRKYAMVLMWSGNDKEAAEELGKTLQ